MDPRLVALAQARVRVVIGLLLLALPEPWIRFSLGTPSREAQALARTTGIRDLVLGIGALNSLKQRNQDAEWVGLGAVTDGVDCAVSLMAQNVPRSRRLLLALTAAVACVINLLCARQLADAGAMSPRGNSATNPSDA